MHRPLARAAAGVAAVMLCSSAAAGEHSLDFETSASSSALSIAVKQFDDHGTTHSDRVFHDGMGREVVLRGWNVSGTAKLKEFGFKPFASITDAQLSLISMASLTGSNVVRLVVAWEGTSPRVDQIDTAYLDAVIAQIRVAVGQRLYVLLDFHQDLYSRHLFPGGSGTTGNGAPKWVIDAGHYPPETCGVCNPWSTYSLFGSSVRAAAKDFWSNRVVHTEAGDRGIQDAFLFQLGESLAYIRSKLSDDEWAFVVGVDPWNEPIDGGLPPASNLPPMTPAAVWDNQMLWPFYRRVRTTMDANGWVEKLVFAEPLVFWNMPPPLGTGGGHLLDIPDRGFVFNAHFYDIVRMAKLPVAGLPVYTVLPGSVGYADDMESVRQEAGRLRMPAFLSEFGFMAPRATKQDANALVAALHQAMNASDAQKASKDRFASTYSPPLSGTQWHWDLYYDQHHEMRNGATPLVTDDAWNGESFSAIRRATTLHPPVGKPTVAYSLDARNVERVLPRRIQGDAIAFHFNARVRDASARELQWLSIRPTIGDQEYFSESRWALLIWRGRKSDAPTEIFLPQSFAPSRLLVITDKVALDGLIPRGDPNQTNNEIMAQPLGGGAVTLGLHGSDSSTGGTHRLLVWDDPDPGETSQSMHYALVVAKDSADPFPPTLMARIKSELDRTILIDQVSPVYFMGSLPWPAYPSDQPPKPFQLTGHTYKWLVWTKADFQWDGAMGRVAVMLNGKQVDTGDAKDSRSFWTVNGSSIYQICELGGRRCSNEWTAPPRQ